MILDYSFYQHYWWFIIALLGGILVFLLFIQGGQSLIYPIGKNENHLKMLLLSLERKWEFTFTTLVTFGGAFFASFPLFYSTSFGGAYWVWMIILFGFIVQAISYQFILKQGNLVGNGIYKAFLLFNGIFAPVLLGAAVSTFFTGSEFIVNKNNIAGAVMPVISSWQNPLHGIEAAFNFWNVAFGLAVFFLARVLACLYFINNIDDEEIRKNSRKQLLYNTIGFLVFFLPYLVFLLVKEGWAVNPANGIVSMEPYKYLHNFIDMPVCLSLFLIGVVLVLGGIITSLVKPGFTKGIWAGGTGTVLVVIALFLLAGYNHTAYYPSTSDLQSSLTFANSSSSLFTLKTMSIVSIIVPFVLAYIWYTWKAMDKKKVTEKEATEEENTY